MKLVCIWLIVTNLIGFALIYNDKQRAIKHKWRIREASLIFIALIGGSLGVLFAMYLFHHKTRHRLFTIGIPLILVLQIAGGVFLFEKFVFQTPRSVLQTNLNALSSSQRSDSTASQILLSLFTNSETDLPAAAGDTNTQLAAQTAALFYQNFQYDIQEISVQGNTASASVSLTTPDTTQLAKDLCLELTKRKITLPSYDAPSEQEILSLIKDTLEAHNYALCVSDCIIYLARTDGRWTVIYDDAYHDAVMGGLISKIDDPWLLDAASIMNVYLDYYNDLSAEQWKSQIQTDDLFGTGSKTFADELDSVYCEKLAAVFKAQLVECTEDGSKAYAQIQITSLDLPQLVERCYDEIIAYAQGSEPLTVDDDALSDAAASCLINGLQMYADKQEMQITVTLRHSSTGWYPVINASVIQAFMGELDEAVSIMQSW